MNFRLRPAAPHELATLSALCLRSKAHWGYDAAFLAACRDELTLTAQDLAQTALCVAECGAVPAGLAQVSRDQDPADLLKFFVDPPFIGAGLGRRLFGWALDETRAQGRSALMIEADPDAEGFYLAMGATRIGQAPSGSIPGRVLPLLRVDL